MFDVHEWNAPVQSVTKVAAGAITLTVTEHVNGLVMVETVIVGPRKSSRRANEADKALREATADAAVQALLATGATLAIRHVSCYSIGASGRKLGPSPETKS